MSATRANPRKRSRLEMEAQPSLEQTTSPTATGEPSLTEEQPELIYDSDYDAQDGDVHRYLLSRDSVVFNDMLSLPQTGQQEGVTEAAPIVLRDRPEEFRTLCWALYALPTELNIQLRPDADLDRLAVLAIIANKYQFLSLEEWAITTIIHHCRHYDFIDNLPLNKTPIYLKIASRSSYRDFRDIVENSIIQRIENKNFNWNNVILAPIEDHGSRRLKGMMHYRLLVCQDSMMPTHQPNTSAIHAAIWNDPNGDRANTTYRGFFSLTKWWERFLITEGDPMALPCSPSCPPARHNRVCQPAWQTWFEELVTEAEKIRPKMDILAKLAKLEMQASSAAANGVLPHYAHIQTTSCLAQWSTHVGYVRQRLIDNMADHFYGPLVGLNPPGLLNN